MPYPIESLNLLKKATNNQCDISQVSGSKYKLEGHSITTQHYIDSDGYPIDGMLIERSVHLLIHKLARTPEKIKEISLDAMRLNLLGIASSALSCGEYTEHLRQWLTYHYARIDYMQVSHIHGTPMTKEETQKINAFYRNKYKQKK